VEQTGETLKLLLATAWLLPLAGFAIEVFGGYWGDRRSKAAAYLAVFCIGTGFVCSTIALFTWLDATDWAALKPASRHGEHASLDAGETSAAAAHFNVLEESVDPHTAGHEEHSEHANHDEHKASAFSGTFYTLARFGSLSLSIDYYIDSLTLVMFMMVTLIATCIHIFAIGYMREELTDDYVDHQVHTSSGGHFHRPGRFYRFFSYMSLFCFSMLGLVIAGNIFMVFVFWELVGICSYLLIGFYVERKSASTAANKAFIMNRVGDFGFLIGLMVIWTWFGTFQFAEHEVDGKPQPGLFQMVRGNDGKLDVDQDEGVAYLRDAGGHRLVDPKTGQERTIPYMLLVVAGLGVFAGCVGKSAQFPLQTWLPDAMEGPTPVSALVHSATMVAAGVYLAGRFFPVFTQEVLLTIAYVGCITLFLAATIAIVATDIKRVLAYSTISQLGYMMLAIGVGGWAAGLFHLITHAFFKSLMFLSSGSVIAGCHHEQEMPRMGGLLKKMPITAIAMLVGVIAISGLAIPGISLMGYKIAFSGYHSKDAIVATALAFTNLNSGHFLLFLVPLVTAGITAFYMFRLWFFTFWGKPRDHHLYEHVHESPWVMTGPLIVLSLFAAFVALAGEEGSLYRLLINSEPAGLANGLPIGSTAAIAHPSHDLIHAVHSEAGAYALLVACIGAVVAYVLYGARIVDPADIKRQLAGTHRFLVEKWQFDNLFDVMFVRPVHVVASWCAAIDRKFIDGFLHGVCRWTIDVSRFDRKFDESVVDGLVNLVGDVTYGIGRSLRNIQTGRLRQYVMFLAAGVVFLFLLLYTLFPA
jgi:NADH-quinone oxidoreductase subunit L